MSIQLQELGLTDQQAEEFAEYINVDDIAKFQRTQPFHKMTYLEWLRRRRDTINKLNSMRKSLINESQEEIRSVDDYLAYIQAKAGE